MATIFTAEFADAMGVGLADVRTPMKLVFARDAAATASWTQDLEDDAVALLVGDLDDGLPRLKVWRWEDEDDDAGDLVANLVWAPMQEDGADGDPATTLSTAQMQFRDPYALLERRDTPAEVVFTGQDAGHILWSLIDTTQTTEGSLGIALGTIQTTTARDRTYNDKQIAEAGNELTSVQGGFDFELAPVDGGATVATFNVYAHQGTDKSTGDNAVVFEYGPGTIGNVRRFTRQTTYPVNKVLVIGANGLRSEQSNAASIAKYGTHKFIEQAVDVSDQSTLDAKAFALLRPDPIRVVSFTPDPATAPQPWRDFWLGDIVRLRARHGTLNLDMAVRINGITLTIDEDGVLASMELAIDQAV